MQALLARILAAFGLATALMLAALATREAPLAAIVMLANAGMQLFISAMLMIFPERFHPPFSGKHNVFGTRQRIFLQAVIMIIPLFSLVQALISYVYTENLKEFQSVLIYIGVLYTLCYSAKAQAA